MINPDLIKLNINFIPVNIGVGTNTTSTYGGTTGTGNPTPVSGSCSSDSMLTAIKNASQGKLDACLTFAMLNTESGCSANAQSAAGACGIAQIMPATAGVSCDKLKSDVNFSITKGVSLLASALSSGKTRGKISGTGDAFNQAAKDLYASYNGGVGCLDASNDCNSSMKNGYGYNYVKWDCPINAAGYKETVTATARFLSSYNTCKSNQAIQNKLN